MRWWTWASATTHEASVGADRWVYRMGWNNSNRGEGFVGTVLRLLRKKASEESFGESDPSSVVERPVKPVKIIALCCKL